MIIGTAGHIDHGKSTLVQALTGKAMDRLADEQRRGITIDLNFAALDLGEGRLAGVVDVPGHEDFIRTMVAGASGMDLLLLVVAADEGLMPQTREHLAIAEQLGIPRGIPVLTKADLVDEDWRELVVDDLAQRLEGSPIEFEPPIVTAAPAGIGLDRLRECIRKVARLTPERTIDDLFRLPVDRAFSVAGVGTVITGTCWSGTAAVGDRVRMVPAGPEARIRSVEVHGRAVERAVPGERVALGLAGIDRKDVGRGQVVVEAETPWREVRAVDASLTLLPGAPAPLVQRRRIRVHLGTREVVARVYPTGRIEAGDAGTARLVCDQPVVVRGGDRLVIRSYSPVTTIGGGIVLDPTPPRHGAKWPPGLQSPVPAERLEALVERRPVGVLTEELPLLLGMPLGPSRDAAEAAEGLARIGTHWIPARLVDTIAERAQALVAGYHRDRPADPGMPLETLRAALGGGHGRRGRGRTRDGGGGGSGGRREWLAAAAIERLEADGKLTVQGGTAVVPGFRPTVTGGDEAVARVVATLERAGLAPPTVTELAGQTAREDAGAILRLAAHAGQVVAVERDRYYAATQLADFVRVLRELGAGAPITPQAIRERLGLSRKFVIPLLEWADREGVTVRVGDSRRLGSRKPG